MLGNQAVKNEKPQVKAATKTQGRVTLDNGNSTMPSEMKAREELNGSKARYEKGMELYKQGKVSINGDGLFKVSGYYEVDTDKMTCTCPDYKSRRGACKHLFASLLFTKNRGKRTIEHLNGLGNSSSGKPETQPNFQPELKEASNKHQESHSKGFDRQATITRLAVLNTATEILKTHRKPIELTDVVSIASQLEKWALGN